MVNYSELSAIQIHGLSSEFCGRTVPRAVPLRLRSLSALLAPREEEVQRLQGRAENSSAHFFNYIIYPKLQ